MNIDGATFIMPRTEYITYEPSGNNNKTRYQNVRIIQQDSSGGGGAILQSQSPSTLTPTQEQIMQAEILFEAPSTAEASLVYFLSFLSFDCVIKLFCVIYRLNLSLN